MKVRFGWLAAAFLLLGAARLEAGDAIPFFKNPLRLDPNRACAADNLTADRFSAEYSVAAKVELCVALDDLTNRLETGNWTSHTRSELEEIWRVYTSGNVFFAPLPPDNVRQMLAEAEALPDLPNDDRFRVRIFVKKGVASKPWFYHVLLHELRHVYDFQHMNYGGRRLPGYEIERRAYHLMSVVDQETPRAIRHSKAPTLWRDGWAKGDPERIEGKREEAIAHYISRAMFFGRIPDDPEPEIVEMTAEQVREDEKLWARPKLIRRPPKGDEAPSGLSFRPVD